MKFFLRKWKSKIENSYIAACRHVPCSQMMMYVCNCFKTMGTKQVFRMTVFKATSGNVLWNSMRTEFHSRDGTAETSLKTKGEFF